MEITTNTPVSERPDTADMSVAALRDEYKTFDLGSIPADDHDRWDRHLEVWSELESRNLVEFPECARDGCDSTRWRFSVGDPAHCAECGEPVTDAEQSSEVHSAANRLMNGEKVEA
jgi:hypothetical protein